MDIFAELKDIGDMLGSASVLAMVRQEVNKVMSEGFVVTDGSHQDGGSEYDIIVRCGFESDNVSRRLRTVMPELKITHIADGLIGLNQTRRGKHGS